MLFGTWLRSVRARQQDEGVDHRELATYASRLTPYVRDELFAALRVVESVYIRTPPEPLSDAEQREMWIDLRDDYIWGIRKALDHMGAALVAVGCTDEELSNTYQVDEEPDEDSEGDLEDGIEESESESEVTVKIPVLADTLTGKAEEEK